jgi:hypothetical protein
MCLRTLGVWWDECGLFEGEVGGDEVIRHGQVQTHRLHVTYIPNTEKRERESKAALNKQRGK